MVLLDQELISYHYASSSCCWGDHFKKSPELRRFKSDRGEIWRDCSSSNYMHQVIESDFGCGIILSR